MDKIKLTGFALLFGLISTSGMAQDIKIQQYGGIGNVDTFVLPSEKNETITEYTVQ